MSMLLKLDWPQSNEVSTERLVGNGVELAYRAIGRGDQPPLVLLQRFRGTMDDWDPMLLDALARGRRVIIFDNVGVGLSPGVAPPTIAAMASEAASFIDRLAQAPVDLLGWSMGGAVAQRIALDRPDLVRRLILAGTGAGGVPQARPMPSRVREIMSKESNDDDDFLYLFFHSTPTSQAHGRAHLARLRRRREAPAPSVGRESVLAQLTAIAAWAAGKGSAYSDLASIRQPTLVLNGVHDVMVDAYQSYVMAQTLHHADLGLYADAGHGFLFQAPERLAQEVLGFLRRT